MPTGRTLLVEQGELRSPLGSVPADRRTGDRGFGCVRRPSYRDLPGVAPSHLFIEPDRRSPAGALLAGMARGYYLLETQGPGHFDLEADSFALMVGGFAVRAGRPTSAVTGARLAGKISRLLMGVQAVARDLAFAPIAGLLGSPSLLVEGLEINAA
jgi:predicted Zn-dependent protease